jgi:copper chaperone
MRSVTLHIEGMSCGHCLNAVNRAINSLPGVTIDSVQIGRASVRFDDSVVTREAIVAAVADAGYRVTSA